MVNSQKVINVIRQAIDQETGDQVKYVPGRVHSTGGSQTALRGINPILVQLASSNPRGQSASAYIRSDDLIEDVIVPSGVFVQSGDYAVFAVSESGKAWIDRPLPLSLYDMIVMDNSRGRIGVGDGASSAFSFGLPGDILVSGGEGGSAYYMTPEYASPQQVYDITNAAVAAHIGSTDPHTQYVQKSLRFDSVLPANVSGTAATGSSDTSAHRDHVHTISSYGCRAYRNSTQTLTSGNDITIDLTSETFDDDTMHDNGTNPSNIVLKRAGRWLITGQISFSASATGTRGTYLLVNGTVVARSRVGASAAQVHRVQATTVVSVANNTSVLTMQGSQNSGGDLTTGTGDDETWLVAMWLGG